MFPGGLRDRFGVDFEAILIAFGAMLGEFGEQFEVDGIVWN